MKIGLDLGGTNFRAGLVDGERLVRKEVVPCPKGTEQEVNAALLALVKRLMTDEVTSIGVGVPPVVDREQGIVYHAANIPAWEEVHLKDIMEDAFHRPVFINNDANCFALGVHAFGEGRDYDDMVVLSLGTCVGSCIIVRVLLYNGRNTCAGEVGSLPFREKDYEHYCASRFFEEYGTTGKQLAEDARRGDPKAHEIWRVFGNNLGCLVQAVLFAYDPEAVFIGGGIADAFDFYKEGMLARLGEFPYPESVARLHIAPSHLENAALLGAAVLDE
jgi:glucokinase